MRIAVLADVHGNLAAFEAALAAARRAAPDLLVLAGDLVNGAPDSRACWALAREEADVLLRGNHERYALDRGTPAGDAAWTGTRFRPLAWTVAELDGWLPEIRAVPIAARPVDGVAVMHAGPDDDQFKVFPWTPEETLAAAFAHVDADLLVRGHNHLPFDRILRDGRTVVSVGAVGLALAGIPEAQWALLSRGSAGWRVEHRSERYDVAATLRRFDETGYLEAAGPIGRLFRREVATGTHQLVPFLRFERAWRAAQGLPPVDEETMGASAPASGAPSAVGAADPRSGGDTQVGADMADRDATRDERALAAAVAAFFDEAG